MIHLSSVIIQGEDLTVTVGS